jgi:hypothetical protein
MPDAQFSFERNHTDLAEFQRRLVVYPLVGKKRTPEEQVNHLISIWRAKTGQLRTAGWGRLSGKRLQYVRNCPPTSIQNVSPRLVTCGIDRLCPFCYSRRAGQIYLQLREATKLLNQRGVQYDMIWTEAKFGLYRNEQNLFHVVDHMLRQRCRHRQQMPSYGSIVHSQLLPVADDPAQLSFTLEHCGIFLVPTDLTTYCWKREPRRKIYRPDRDQVRSLVVKALSYPKSLLLAPAETTIQLMELSFKRRLVERGGVFRDCESPINDKLNSLTNLQIDSSLIVSDNNESDDFDFQDREQELTDACPQENASDEYRAADAADDLRLQQSDDTFPAV